MEVAAEKGWSKVTETYYRRIFTENFNIGFRLPRTDTCKTCDEYTMQSKSLEAEEGEQRTKEWEDHKRKADSAFKLLRLETEKAAENPLAQHTICFDLQQAMPTPKLSSGPAFYKRKLWTYNLCVHDCGSKTAFMFMWPETVGGRGSSDIGSCLLKYFELADIASKTLVAFSDNCAGQNKNYNIMSLWLYLISTGKFTEIRHCFPISGHTMMPCDRDFGSIEQQLRKRQYVYTPKDYMDIVSQARVHKPFTVVEMTSSDFVSFDALSDLLVKRHKTNAGNNWNFTEVCQFRFSSEMPMSVEITFGFDDEEWQRVNLQRRGRPTRMSEVVLKQRYEGPRPVPKAKLDDVLSLLRFVPPVHHDFYRNVTADERQTCTLQNECEDVDQTTMLSLIWLKMESEKTTATGKRTTAAEKRKATKAIKKNPKKP